MRSTLSGIDERALEIGHTVAMLRARRVSFIKRIGPKTWRRETAFTSKMEEHGEVSVDGILGSGEGDCYEMVASSFRSLQGQALEADFVIFGLTVKYEQENDMFIPAKRCCKCYFMHPYPETLLGYDRPKPGEPSGPASPWNKKYLAGNCSEALSFALLEAVCRRQKEVFTPKLPVLII